MLRCRLRLADEARSHRLLTQLTTVYNIPTGAMCLACRYYATRICRLPTVHCAAGPMRQLLERHCPLLFRHYCPPFWCFNAHAQTILAGERHAVSCFAILVGNSSACLLHGVLRVRPLIICTAPRAAVSICLCCYDQYLLIRVACSV